MKSILVTGCSGLIGTAVSTALLRRKRHVLGMDLKGPAELRIDVRDIRHSIAKLDCVSGIVHLAAVSRVIHGERDPELCWAVNVEGTRAVLDLASRLRLRPWIICASSREVYGEQSKLPVQEHAEQKPLNAYARSKAAAEQLVGQARDNGAIACVLRFSNVYGSVNDHADRVMPAFAAAAAQGGTVRVDDPHGQFDFTYLGDVVDGVLRVIDLLDAPDPMPPQPIHLTTGIPTSLERLAELAIELGLSSTSITYGTPRAFDVQRFYGDPSRAAEVLGWKPLTDLRTGFTRLVKEFRSRGNLGPLPHQAHQRLGGRK